MAKKPIKAYTTNYNGVTNTLHLDVEVSASKNLNSNSEFKQFKGIWDTGATNSAINPKIVKECNLIPSGKTIVNTAGGIQEQNTYIVDIKISKDVTISDVVVNEMAEIDSTDVLIGMDIITLGDFAISNCNGKTVFSFRIPTTSTIDFVKQAQALTQNTSHKIGRNDDCPCGSGRKYKKCCGALVGTR